MIPIPKDIANIAIDPTIKDPVDNENNIIVAAPGHGISPVMKEIGRNDDTLAETIFGSDVQWFFRVKASIIVLTNKDKPIPAIIR